MGVQSAGGVSVVNSSVASNNATAGDGVRA